MNEFNSSQIALSHKQLNKLLAKAPKDHSTSIEQEEIISEDNKRFDDLLRDWASISQKLLKDLKNKDNNILSSRKPKALMALGALESYLYLALQAKDASE